DRLQRGHAHRTTRTVHQLDLGRQPPIDPVADDRARLTAARLQDHPRAARDARDLPQEALGDGRIAVLLEVLHDPAPSGSGSVTSAVWPSCSSTRQAVSAWARSLFAIARRTCTSTKSPTTTSGWHARQTSRVTPPKRTLPYGNPSRSLSAAPSPGIQRHRGAPPRRTRSPADATRPPPGPARGRRRCTEGA